MALSIRANTRFVMSILQHTLVWIDHREARIFHFDATDVERTVVRSAHPDQHIHHKANSPDSGHAGVDTDFLKRVTQAIAPTGSIVIAGPANAKSELAGYIRRTHPTLGANIRGVEPLDHPNDSELLKLGHRFFKAEDVVQEMLHR
jgi:stalled ribosome rescue protein Dom34